MTTAVKASLRFIGTCGELSPLLPLPSPVLSLLSEGFPECNTQGHPSISWTIVRSWEHLPFLSLSLPLSFFPSLFPLFTLFPGCSWMLRHSWEPFLFGVSLDACVVAGSTFVSFFLSLSFLPPPAPSFLARGVFTSKLGFCNRFF